MVYAGAHARWVNARECTWDCCKCALLQWSEGLRHGHGIMVHVDGSVYDGTRALHALCMRAFVCVCVCVCARARAHTHT
ncbi:hypothetical protein EON67_11120, partial [archaeon]